MSVTKSRAMVAAVTVAASIGLWPSNGTAEAVAAAAAVTLWVAWSVADRSKWSRNRTVKITRPDARIERSKPVLTSGVVTGTTLALVCVTGVSAGAALREDATESFTHAISDGTTRAGSTAAKHNTEVDIPTSGESEIVAAGVGGTVTIDTPAKGHGHVADDELTRVYSGQLDDSRVAVQPTADGVRAAIAIDSADAPERYPFELGGDAERLVLDEQDGSVWVFGNGKEPLGRFESPWAYDAAGRTVPTHYEVSGTTLTQVVEHKAGDFSYGITADPKWSKKWIKKFKKLFKVCLGLTLSTEALLQLVSSPNKAAKFMVRRLGLFGAVYCGGGIIKELL
ncbi:hypothetical protein [Aeromicrobium erythreum]|uniref:hypothetical protein n=1 Tax=Aeromicrobium erythreum TaxID=2041 RepID=UPI000AF6E7C9|nr:hypothetical protein [Aeromicrobium erythreum]